MPTPLLSRFPLRESADDPRRGLIGAVMLAGGIQGRDNLALAYGEARKGLRFIVMVRNPTLRAFSWCKPSRIPTVPLPTAWQQCGNHKTFTSAREQGTPWCSVEFGLEGQDEKERCPW